MEAGAIVAAEAGADGHLIPDGEMYDVADSIPAATGGTPVSDGWVHPLHLVEIGLDG